MNRQPSMHLTKSNPITDIPYHQRQILCARLDSYDDWKKFVGHIKSKDGLSPRYDNFHLCLFDKEKERKRGSPTDAILNDWRSLRPTIGELLDLLISVELMDTANYINEVVLQQGRLKEPVEVHDGPMVELTDSINPTSFAPFSRPVFQPPPSMYMEPPSSIVEHQYLSILDCDTEKSIQDYLSSEQEEPIKHFTYSELELFTESFSPESLNNGGRFLGKGGYGEVYLGTIKSVDRNEMVAVKRFHEASLEYLRQFKTELEVIFMNCRHPNLLSIKGICTERSFCVVYEYMVNGTLEQRLADMDRAALTAERRLNIAIDVAKGLARLHSSHSPIVHRDVKPANILLDDALTAKLGDYGLVRVQTLQENSHTNMTTKVIGSRYYMPPESATGIVSPKWDVYSFGVVLLELLFAKGPEHRNVQGYNEKLIEYLFDDEPDEDPLTLLDPRCNWDHSVAKKLLNLAEQCGQKWKKRPLISGCEDAVLETLLRIQEDSICTKS